MTFLVRARALLFEDPVHERALETWRAAEDDVRDRWDRFLAAAGEARTFAFAAYVAALDREAAAAGDVAALASIERAA